MIEIFGKNVHPNLLNLRHLHRYTLSAYVNEITKIISSKEENIVHFNNITVLNMYMSLKFHVHYNKKSI